MVKHGWTAAALLLALGCAAVPARAGLAIDAFWAEASAEVGETHTTADSQYAASDDPHSLPFALSANAEANAAYATALQTKGGFYAVRSGGDSAPLGLRTSGSTLYELTVRTDQPDTPLRLTFRFLGARADAYAYYGEGDIEAGVYASIYAGRLGGGNVPPVWGFEDRVLLDQHGSNNGSFTTQSNGTDVYGIGLPQRSDSVGWDGFRSFGQVTRAAFSATLDFGLLQPGELFQIAYEAGVFADIDSAPYMGRADAGLVDPFALDEPPPFMIAIEGLALPTAPVPEPASSVLLLAGALLLVALKRQSSTAAGSLSVRTASNADCACG
jgi:hypothetical protein